MLDWKSPTSLTEVQSFLGFANFYRRFIQDYSRVAWPLTELTKKTEKWAWNQQVEKTFQELKKRFTTAPILSHFDAQKPVIIETDASDFAIGAILSQRDSEGRLHPVAFHSRKFQPVKINYEIHDKELLAIVDAFKHWRRYCKGAVHQVQVFSDQQDMEYFTTTKILNGRQVRWAQELAGINFRIYYRPGSQNWKPDALSRPPEYHPKKEVGENQPITTALHGNQIEERQARSFICTSARLKSNLKRKWNSDFKEEVLKKTKEDTDYQLAWKTLQEEEGTQEEAVRSKEQRTDRKARSVMEIRDRMLYRKNLLWVLKGLIQQILESEQDTKVAGHKGQNKTIELVRRNFWGPK